LRAFAACSGTAKAVVAIRVQKVIAIQRALPGLTGLIIYSNGNRL
jgi:hypothetical protein